MASKALRGLTIEIGGDTTELNKALDQVDKKTRSLSSELGQINKALKLDPTNTELLAQKQKVLAEAISNTEDKLDTLKEAEKEVQKQFERGEVSEEQVRALRREIIETERKLDGYKNAAKETAEAVDKLGDEAEDTGKEIEKQGDKTKETEKETEDMNDAADDLASEGLAAVATAAAAAVTAIVALAEESREYRNEMAKLNTAFEDNNLSAEAATATYEELQSILGETDQAVEAATLLSGFCETEEELAQWTEILTGAYAKFGNSLPIEGLAEAVNETVRTGQVTGSLADALNWATKEGEMFGLQLKEQIEFTELSKEELKLLSEEELEAYEIQKRRYENIEEWNGAILEAASAEDMFNIALSECSTEQERQQLITKYLTGTYEAAAKQYKETNKEVIRSNQATEKWNKATAKIGKTVEPVVTDIKEFGVALLEDASEPLEDIADFIRRDVLPALKSTGAWVKKNGPTIKATLIGVTAALVTYKVATIAAEVAQKGLKGAIMATEVAQKALALAQAATPWGLAAVAIAGVTAALVAYTEANKKAIEPADVLTDEEKELAAAADEAAESFREQRKATDEALGNVTAEMDHIKDMTRELHGLADASGRVKEEDQKRANFIINELNEALGTEYEMVDGVILQYDELRGTIQEVIRQKTANALLEAGNADYVRALQDEADAWNNTKLKQKEYEAQLAVTREAEEAWMEADAEYTEAKLSGNNVWIENAAYAAEEAEKAYWKQKGYLDDTKAEYDKSQAHYDELQETVLNYEKAQEEALNGNYQTAIDIFSKKGELYTDHADTVDDETAQVLATLEKEAYDAGQKAIQTRKNFENGVEGYTEDMVTEAEQGYLDALGKFNTAYEDAYGVGSDFGQGLADGIKIKNGAVGAAAIRQIQRAVQAARQEAQIRSPSRKTMEIGEYMGEGAEIGIEKKTKDVEKAATNQAAAILDAYSAQEVNAQRALRNIAEQQTSRQMAGQQAMASTNSPMLEKILAAIEKGQIITLDGDALVGATANKMDTALGHRRALASRGAI